MKEAYQIMKASEKEKNFKKLCYTIAGHMITLPYQPIPNCEDYGRTIEMEYRQQLILGERQYSFYNK